MNTHKTIFSTLLGGAALVMLIASCSFAGDIEDLREKAPRFAYKVTFNSNGGGAAIPSQAVVKGGKAEEPPDPGTVPGYVFGGWYIDADFTNLDMRWDFSHNTVTGYITLYARWIDENDACRVYFYPDSDPSYFIYVASGEKVKEPPIKNKVGYDYKGWHIGSTDGEKWEFASDTVEENIGLYERWEIKQYEIYFYLEGGTPDLPGSIENPPAYILVNHGSQITEPAITKAGYTYGGWYTNSSYSSTARWDFSTPVTGGPIYLWARWLPNPIPGTTLAAKLQWLKDNESWIDDSEFTIDVSANEELAPQALSYNDMKNLRINLTGGGSEKTLTLSGNGSLFTIDSGVKLTLGNNVTLQGHDSNTDALVTVDSSGELEMNTESKITGNTGGGVNVINNGTFSLNGGTISSNTLGVFVSGSSSNFTMISGEISGNIGSGVFIGSYGLFTMNGGKITGNTANDYGGGVNVGSRGSFIMESGEISDNIAGYGGGVCTAGSSHGPGSFTMEGGKILNNRAIGYYDDGYYYYDGNGGGVYAGGGFDMYGGVISGNTAVDCGGGVYQGNRGEFFMESGTIGVTEFGTANTANSGGGVYVDQNGAFDMSGDAAISGNTANDSGGGVWVCSGTFSMSGDAAISGNNAEGGDGGGVYVDSGTFDMSGDATISSNSAFCGGGVCVAGNEYTNGIFTMSGGTISVNTAYQAGGGVASSHGTFTMNGGKITNNITNGNSYSRGGGVSLENSEFIMTSGEIANNTANIYGGGVCLDGGTFTMNGDAVISDNTTYNGGGVSIISVWSYNSGTFTMEGGTISGNTASSGNGGGVFVWSSGGITMSGGTISGNTAPFGGGVCVQDGTFMLSGGTISGNTASSGNGGGVCVDNTGTFTMSGGTISGNTASSRGGGVFVNWLTFRKAPAGSGNTSGTITGYTPGDNNSNVVGTRDGGGNIVSVIPNQGHAVYVDGDPVKLRDDTVWPTESLDSGTSAGWVSP